MDINRLFRSGMRSCGRVLNILPKDEIGSPMQYMMEVLREETIPSLNIVFPRLYHATFSISHLIKVADQTSPEEYGLDSKYIAFRIPKKLTEGLSIMSVKSCNPSTHTASSSQSGWRYDGLLTIQQNHGYSGRYGRYSSANLYEAAAIAQLNYADRQLAGQFTSAFRYYFYPPNILFLFGDYITDTLTLDCVFCLENDENLVSIEDTAYEGVRRLFILDLKKSIYNSYSIYDNISTPNGELSSKIDEWSSAESDRNELYDTYLATAHFRTSAMRTG